MQHLINSLDETKEIKPKRVISTIFGDLARPYGGLMWVETLSAILTPLGISERLVRTSLFRLVEEGWLIGTRSGRKSHYGLTSLGASQTKLAESLIYHREDKPWDGSWTLVFLVMNPVDVNARNLLEQELSWIGFGRVANHVWAHPCIPTGVILERVKEQGLLDKVICMRCENIQSIESGFQLNDKDLAMNCMPISEIQLEYQTFIDRFEAFLNCLDSLVVEELLLLRILLIDQYRRIVLNDPNLPKELLPDDWNGELAYAMTAGIYNSIKQQTDKEFVALMNRSERTLAKAFDKTFAYRFLVTTQ